MFGFGILTYLKIGAVVVILGVAGYFVYEYRHMATQIVALKDEIEGLKLRAEVIKKAQAATDKFMQAKTKVVTRNVQQKAEVDQVVEAGDNSGMQSLFIQHGLLNAPKTGTAPGRPAGGAGNIPR